MPLTWRARLPGLAISMAVGCSAWLLSRMHVVFEPLIVACVSGILLGNLLGRRQALDAGLDAAVSLFLPLGIILYGMSLRLDLLAVVPAMAWLQLLAGMLAVFVLCLAAGRWLGLSDRLSSLVAVGSSICGASAIAIATPALRAKREETSAALLAIAFVGGVELFCYPGLRPRLGLDENGYAFFSATTLPMTGFVVLATSTLQASAQALALAVKMARTAFMIPLLLLLAVLLPPPTSADGSRPGRGGIPWFLYAFVFMGLLCSFFPAAASLTAPSKLLASASFAVALAAIGLTADIRTALPHMVRTAALAASAWLALAGVFLLGQAILG